MAVAAAGFQTVRFLLQRQLSQVRLTATGATFARFVYSAPAAAALTAVYLWAQGAALPALNAGFWAYGAVGGAGQVAATICTVMLFGRRNFAVGMTLIKTEVLLTALVGIVLLGEVISAAGLGAILLGLAGVLVLSAPAAAPGRWRLLSPSAGLGLAAGALFGVSAVCYRAASLELGGTDPFLSAGVTLAAVTLMQMIGMAVWMAWREPGEAARVLAAWRSAGWIGLTSMAGSFCWFTAFTLQTAAYVKAVGQVELIFGLIVSVLLLCERITARELIGMALLSLSILALIMLT
ncbi:EamA-like transporter family protein [Salinihabitans flavidus]|uniref:EamA-like transporter family protein n=2 Tax=Salinihabitans flavidus TaxID=569882 RepID=A0A1H8TQG0_9RHOB|nr:EamA-like transporter family protein [Salinihabitans flavidus]